MEPIIDPTFGVDGYRLTTGRELQCNQGLIGINPQLRVTEGYDGSLNEATTDPERENRWTMAERAEVADYMIALWQQFKAQTVNP